MNQAELNRKKLIVKKQISIVGMASKEEIDILRQLQKEKLSHLDRLGLTVRNGGASVFLNRISPGCIDCSRHTGLTVDVTRECNRNCYFCFYPGPHKEKTKLINIIRRIFIEKVSMLSFAITGGECLLDINKTVNILELAKMIVGSICQTRIYTNGDMLNWRIFKKLQAAKLDEIRISIKPGEKDYKMIKLAKDYIPRVMIEMPVFPDREEEMKDILLKLNNLKIFGINLLEFVFCSRNAYAYRKRGYKLLTDKVNFNRPLHFDYPVYGSETACFNILEFAAKEKVSIGVHYCSFKNKSYGNHNEILMKKEISRRIKSEFIKNRKCNKKQFILKYWVDGVLKKNSLP